MQAISRNDCGFAAACTLSFLVLLAAYSNHFHNSFHFDDSHVIQDNLYIRSLKNVPLFFTDARTFSSLPANSVYRPVLSTTFAFDYWMAGRLKPWQFHVTQFALLVLLGAGLVFLFRRVMDLAAVHLWNRYAALFAALFFCLHTANTETVNYISSRSDLLSTLGVVTAFLIYLFLPRWRRFYLYLFPMVFGALAKPPAIMFAPLLLVFAVLFEQQLSCSDLLSPKSWRRLWSAIQRALPACIAALALFWFLGHMNAPSQTYGGTTPFRYFLTQPFVWLRYVRLFILPLGLTADTDWKPLTNWYDTRFFAGLFFMALLLRVIWSASRSQELRPVAFGLVWFGIALVPSSSIFPLAEVANEHRIFFPFIGLTLAAVWWVALQIHRLWDTRPPLRRFMAPIAWGAALLILCAHAVGTYRRNTVWRSGETLWGDVVRKSPANGRALMNYGLTRMSQAKYLEAKTLFERASIYLPNYSYLETNLGIVTDKLGDEAVAERHFLRALQLQPGFVEGHYFYARWLVDRGRSHEAIAHLRKAIELSPAKSSARVLLMDLYAAKGAEADLRRLARDTLAILPTDPAASAYAAGEIPSTVRNPSPQNYYESGVRLTARAQHLRAALAYRQALKLNPESADAYNNLGWSLARLGFYEESLPAFTQALHLRPGFDLAKNNLAWARNQLAHKQ